MARRERIRTRKNYQIRALRTKAPKVEVFSHVLLDCNQETKVEPRFHSKLNLRSRPLPNTSDRRRINPEEYPDLNFHHNYGSFLTHKSPVAYSTHPTIAAYWDILTTSPTLLQHHIHSINEQYRTAFRGFFTADPLSIHGHVSDASSTPLLTSLICHLISHATPRFRNTLLTNDAKHSPRLCILEGSYGAGYGSLAYNAAMSSVHVLGNGPRPIIIKPQIATDIEIQIQHAKEQGCIALIAEIVRASDGEPITQSAWRDLLLACKKHSLMLVVDEALTSIRCGAPFAYQLPQYSKHGHPDLILFGKAVRTNGVAIDWHGINTQKMGIRSPDKREFVALEWQERFTETAQAADLLNSWGTLTLAKRENWPQRAQEVGILLRQFICHDGIKATDIGGLHGLIYLRVKDVKTLKSPVMGAKAGEYVRWFPALDAVMTSERELKGKIFGEGSIAHRKELWEYLEGQKLRLGFCSECGDAVGDDVGGCEVCVVSVHKECESDRHECPMKDDG
ncbi:MAG: hypothetical protein Q9216_003798 [Gyalolechia sp. 2 TL-2023]